MAFVKSFFHSTFINPSEYTIVSKDGSHTYIKDEVIKSKAQLCDLCELVCPQITSPKKRLKLIVKSAKSILDTTSNHARNFYSKALKTTDVSEFFKSVEVVKADYSRMSEIERYVYYGADPSNVALYRLNERLQIEIRHLIDRAYTHSQTLKNSVSIAQKQYAEFQKYISVMDEKSIKKLNSKYKNYLDQ